MKLDFRFRSLSDWSDPEQGKELPRLLESHGLHIAKWDDKEPLRKSFDALSQPSQYWIGRSGSSGHRSCYFLFRGQHTHRFAGMIIWRKGLPLGSTLFNVLCVEVTDLRGKLTPAWALALGDALFDWSKATSGFVTRTALHDPLAQPPAMRIYLPGLYWANYFGEPYLANPKFPKHPNERVVGHGKRVLLTEHYDSELLSDPEYLQAEQVRWGSGWFGQGPADQWLAPSFDFSAINVQELL